MAATAQQSSRLSTRGNVDGEHFEPLNFWCVLFILSMLVSVNVIDTNRCSATIVRNVLILWPRLLHSMVSTN